MDASLTIIRRRVKHARLRVRQDRTVELVVPKDWKSGEIDGLLRRNGWIEEKQTFFRTRERGRRTLDSNEVMLFGEHFRIQKDERLDGGVEVDRAGRCLRVAHAFACDTSFRAWQREFAKTVLSKRTSELSEKHGLQFGRLFVRSQLTKWGSCSARRNISLNWRLVRAPERVIDYVILHELLHTKVMNHSQTFWAHLHALCPWAKGAITWLNAHQPETDWKAHSREV
jgi:predicted metal-dependent hydrolase